MNDFVPVKRVDDSGFTPTKKVEPGPSGVMTSVIRPTLEFGGLAAGGILGSGAGPAGTVAGGALGYAAGKQAANFIEEILGYRVTPSLPEQLVESGKDILQGAEMEMGGQLIGKGLSVVGKGAAQLVGRLTGTGTASIEQAIIGSQTFKDALRGKISPQAIVDHARDALSVLKNNRAQAYRKQLAEIAKDNVDIDTTPITNELQQLMDQYNVIIKADGRLDLSRIKMGKAGRSDIEEIIDLVAKWGKKAGDRTVLGLDVLKSQLDDFYSDSSQARQFVASLRNAVRKTIVTAEPRYDKMTKAYSEATMLVKDIESNLMLRKQGMSGRIVADQTLRRLISAMKDNFALRRELVEALGNQSAHELTEEIAGHAMSSWAPRGISGTGIAITNAAIAYTLNPKFWPILAASSPRVSAEFLTIYGKALKNMNSAISRSTQQFISYEALKNGPIQQSKEK